MKIRLVLSPDVEFVRLSFPTYSPNLTLSSPASEGKLRFEKRLLDFQERKTAFEEQLRKRLLPECVCLIDIQQGAQNPNTNTNTK